MVETENAKKKLAGLREKIVIDEDDLSPSSSEPQQNPPSAPKTPAKTITVIAEEIIAEKKAQTEGAPAKEKTVEVVETVHKEMEESGQKENEQVEAPKTITVIAEQARKEKENEQVEAPKTITAIAEQARKEKEKTTQAGLPEEMVVALEEEEQAAPAQPRKTIMAIAEEIRKEKGIPEKQARKDEKPLPAPPAPPYSTTPLPKEVVEKMEKAHAEGEQGEFKRLYLLSPQERSKLLGEGESQPGDVRKKRYGEGQAPEAEPAKQAQPGDEGFETMVSDVYGQVKEEEERQKPLLKAQADEEKKKKEEQARHEFEERRRQREERRRALEEKKNPPKEAPKPAEPVQILSIEDILGEKKGEKAQAPPGGIFGELEKETEGAPAGKELFGQLEAESALPPSGKKLAEFSEVSKDKGCPNCKSNATKVVYCPYCGGAMCATCATSIQTFPDHFTYTCPHCGEEVEVKKKAA